MHASFSMRPLQALLLVLNWLQFFFPLIFNQIRQNLELFDFWSCSIHPVEETGYVNLNVTSTKKCDLLKRIPTILMEFSGKFDWVKWWKMWWNWLVRLKPWNRLHRPRLGRINSQDFDKTRRKSSFWIMSDKVWWRWLIHRN